MLRPRTLCPRRQLPLQVCWAFEEHLNESVDDVDEPPPPAAAIQAQAAAQAREERCGRPAAPGPQPARARRAHRAWRSTRPPNPAIPSDLRRSRRPLTPARRPVAGPRLSGPLVFSSGAPPTSRGRVGDGVGHHPPHDPQTSSGLLHSLPAPVDRDEQPVPQARAACWLPCWVGCSNPVLLLVLVAPVVFYVCVVGCCPRYHDKHGPTSNPSDEYRIIATMSLAMMYDLTVGR